MRLSYSQMRLYTECGRKYQFYYQNKLREKSRSSALCFGEALDKALEAALKHPEMDETVAFDTWFTHQMINGEKTYIPESTLVTYSAKDLDVDLFQDDDIAFLKAKATELNLGDEHPSGMALVIAQNKKVRPLQTAETLFLNLASFMSLRRKAHLMLKANRDRVLSRISKLHGTQVKIELGNPDGDSLIGYADLHCDFDEETMVIDYKSSSIDYAPNSVKRSTQLTLYAHALGVKRAGYVVFNKNIKKDVGKVCTLCSFDGSGTAFRTCNNTVNEKRCNGEWKKSFKFFVDVQIIIDTIPPRTEEIVLENLEQINKSIKDGIFIRNLNACIGNFGPCPYIKLCYENDSSDLISSS